MPLQNQETLDNIRYFKGSFEEFKKMMDKKAGANTNAYDDTEAEYPKKKKLTGSQPVYQTFDIVNNPNEVHEMKNIKSFDTYNQNSNEDYVGFGFGAPSTYNASYGIGYSMGQYDGYNLQGIVMHLDNLGKGLEDGAEDHENNEDPEQSAKGFLKRAHAEIKKRLKDIYNKFNTSREEIEEDNDLMEDFDALKKMQTIKDRNERNKKRLEMARAKGNKMSEQIYKLRMQLDKIDMEKTKLKEQIQRLQMQAEKSKKV